MDALLWELYTLCHKDIKKIWGLYNFGNYIHYDTKI